MAIDVKKWMGRVLRAESFLNERKKERINAIKLYTGTFFGSALDNVRELSEVNFLYEYVDVMISALYARYPHIFCRANSSRLVAFAETMEKVLNYYIYELKFKKKIQSCLVDSILQPPGWIGLGYLYINEKTRVKKQVEEEFPELKEIGKEEKSESSLGFLEESIKFDDVYLEYISSWNVGFPDGYHYIKDCPWMYQKQTVTLEDLKKNPMFNDNKFKITGKSLANPQKPNIFKMAAQVIPTNMGVSTADEELINLDLFHIWDRRDMQRFTIARNFYDGVIFERKWDYLSEGFPLFPLIFNEIPATDEKANAYPMSDVIPMYPQLKELSLVSSAINRHRKRAGTLLLGRKGQIKETDAAEIQRGKDVDLVLLDDISEGAIRGFTPPALPQDFYRQREIILDDLLRISGYTQLLGVSKGVDTATESENIKMGAVLRQSRRVDLGEEHVRDIAIFLAGLLWQFKSKNQIAEIIGEEVNEEMWPTIPEDINEARKIIQKQLNFRIEAGSMRPPKDEAVERKQWTDLAGSIKANFPNRVKDDVFLMQLLKKYDFKDIEKMVITHDEEEVSAAQQENQLLMQNIKQIVSPNEHHMLHLQVHAQTYQTPGLTPTDAMNEHIDSHAKFMEMSSPKTNPQRGDTKPQATSTTPEQARGGVTEYADLIGAVKSQQGTGINTGG